MAEAAQESFRLYFERAALVNNGGWYLEPWFARALLRETAHAIPLMPEDQHVNLSPLPWLLCSGGRQCQACNQATLPQHHRAVGQQTELETVAANGISSCNSILTASPPIVHAADPLYMALLRRMDHWLSSKDFSPWPTESCGAMLEGLLVTKHWLQSKRDKALILVNAITRTPHAALVLIDSLFRVLGHRGVQQLLGLRTTKGTVDTSLPPSALALLCAFEATHAESNSASAAAMTVGARAWTKHCHRSADGWWGISRGGTFVNVGVGL
jgi:hypothetical protein